MKTRKKVKGKCLRDANLILLNTITTQKVLNRQCSYFVPTSGIWTHFQNVGSMPQ